IALSVANQAASLAAKGTQLDSRLEVAMNKASAVKNMSLDEVNARIADVISKANAHDNAAQRKSVIARLDREFPGAMLGTHINAIRENNWQMANQLIDYRINDARPLTRKELATYRKMLDEQERWTTRAYQSQMAHRDLYASTFMKRAENSDSQEAKDLAAALDVIKTRYLSIPPNKTLEELPLFKLEELYKAWE